MATFADLEFKARSIGGIYARCDFENGYTASVVRGLGTYGGDEGLYEAAVTYDGRLIYDTPVTEDVEGHLTEDDVTDFLRKVEALPARKVRA